MLNNLKSIVQLVVGMYVPMWFIIKVNKDWLEGPRHILKQLRLVRGLNADTQDIVVHYINSSV